MTYEVTPLQSKMPLIHWTLNYHKLQPSQLDKLSLVTISLYKVTEECIKLSASSSTST